MQEQNLDKLAPSIARIEDYLAAHFWDPDGILYAYVDVQTGKPFEKDFITREKVARRAAFNPWAWWTYEDSIQNSGHYLDGLVRKYEVTGDAECLRRANDVWQMLEKVYLASQVHGIGSFLRPYGGFLEMEKFMEPLGTDQASPMFAGLYRYLRHAPPEEREQIGDLLLKTLTWYEQQGFRYFYYKWLIHEWAPPLQHAGSYYLPAIAWAAKTTGDSRWSRHFESRISQFSHDRVPLEKSYETFNLYRTFYWGGDLPVLKEILGERFDEYLPPAMRENAFALALEDIAKTYSDPGTIRTFYPESREPGFKPYVRPGYNPDVAHGFAYYSTVHGGSARPRLEVNFLCGLAALGHRGAYQKAVELLLHRQRVPHDFTEFLYEDHDRLPPQVDLYARSTGSLLFEWFRNYWMLKQTAG